MPKNSCVPIIVQILLVAAATVLAFAKIETIQFSGPVLAVSGLVMAFASFRKNRPCGLYLGLIMPTTYVLCFSLILGFGWGPDQAQKPVWAILIDVVLIHLWLGYFAIRELAAPSR